MPVSSVMPVTGVCRPTAASSGRSVDGRGDLLPHRRVRGCSGWPSRPSCRGGTARRAALLAWMVVRLPSWPVFMAWSMSSASSPRTSPMMMRSGRMRSALITRSRCLTAPLPSMFGGRVSSRTTWRCRSISSAASSMVTMRSLSEMKPESTFSSVVLPAPVPPETMTFSRQATAASRKSSIGCVSASRSTRSCAPSDRCGSGGSRGRAVEGQRRDDGVDARAVGQPCVDHRARLVDAAADRADDALDDLQQVRSSLKRRRSPRAALALDEDLVEAVDQDVRDRRVAAAALRAGRGRTARRGRRRSSTRARRG